MSAKARRARAQQRVIPVIGFLGWERAVRTTRAMNSRRFMSEHWDFLPDAGGGALLLTAPAKMKPGLVRFGPDIEPISPDQLMTLSRRQLAARGKDWIIRTQTGTTQGRPRHDLWTKLR